ncbi:MAG: ABC transporter ATP-binding protein [Myxococcales bacterium]|nr:ABC transporter ATP-binding protein [Myxococcales bacterium]
MSAGAVPDSLLAEVATQGVAAPARGDAALWRRLGPYLRGQMRWLLAALLVMPVGALAAGVQPLFTKWAVDAALVARELSGVLAAAFGLLGALLVEALARFAQMAFMHVGGQRALVALRADLFAHAQRLSLRYLDRTPVGRVATRLTHDVDALFELFSTGAVMAPADVLTMAAYLGVMFWLDWRLALVACVLLPPLGVAVEWIRRRARVAFREVRARVAQLHAYVAEQAQGVAVVQAFGRQARCAQEHRRINDAHRRANYAAIRYDALLYSIVESVAAASAALVLGFAAFRLEAVDSTAEATAWMGTLVAFYDFIQRFFTPLRDFSTKYTVIQSALAACERMFELLDERDLDAPRSWSSSDDTESREARIGSASPRARRAPESVRFEGVRLAYRPGFPVLHGVDFEVPAGQCVGLVGPSGSGKSSLAALLVRLYELDGGSIRIGDRDVREIPIALLRRRVALVQQEVLLLSGTVLDNVVLGTGRPDVERARWALARAGLWERLEARGGLSARVEERGANFSLGERQLLAFARVFYRDPEIVVLDEATASVDSETEARVQQASRELLRGRTALLIAHRLSTLRDVSRVVVLGEGRVVEQGGFDELVRRGGSFARLVRLQASLERPHAAALDET